MTPAAAMEEQPELPEAPTDSTAGGTIFTPYRRTQFFVVTASVGCFLLFWWAGNALGIPQEKGFEASVLQQPHWPVDLLAIYVLFGVCVVISTLIAGSRWFFAGLFAAAVGLIALSMRGGSSRYVLFHAANIGRLGDVYLTLALEQALLFVPVALVWFSLHRRYEIRVAAARASETADAQPTSQGNVVMAVLTQVVLMGFASLLFIPTEAKTQVLIGLFIAGFVGSSLAEYFFPDRRNGRFYWVGPLLVGLIGYLLAQLSNPSYTIGVPPGSFASLARPLPLDYASTGVAGALLGFWIGAERPEMAASIFASAVFGGVVKARTVRRLGIQGRARPNESEPGGGPAR